MATRKLVPRADDEGGIGTALLRWASGWIKLLTVLTINKLTITEPATGATLTIADGKTLTVSDSATAGGPAVNPTLPAFLAYNSANNISVTGNGTAYTCEFDTEVFDQANNFAANIFTAPVTGKYLFKITLCLFGLAAAHNDHTVVLITTNRNYYFHDSMPVGANPFVQWRTIDLGVITDMDAGETAYVLLNISGGNKDVGLYGTSTPDTRFSGHLVC
jgi:hypothetical protein